MKEKRHASLGIASFILSLVARAGMFVLVVLAGVLEGFTSRGQSEESMEAFLIGVVLICGLLLEVLSLGLGIGPVSASAVEDFSRPGGGLRRGCFVRNHIPGGHRGDHRIMRPVLCCRR